MPKVWNIGNTTVRNPKRIENALRVFVEEGFSGNAKGSITEARLHEKLKERNVLEFDGQSSDLNGRKWRAAFYQLGFISFEDYYIEQRQYSIEELFRQLNISNVDRGYQITPAGLKLISASSVPEIEDIYTRQFACYELPNTLEGNFPAGAKMKPFILFLQVIKKLQDLNVDGLNKYETGLFLQKFRDHTDGLHDEIVNEILLFRNELSNCRNASEIRDVKNRYKEELRTFAGIDPSSVVRDYSDTTFRYFTLSGLFTRIGDTIVIRANKRNFVDKLLENEPTFLFQSNPLEFFRNYYSNNFPVPTDNIEVALEEIDLLKRGIRDQRNPLLVQANLLNTQSSLPVVQQIRYALIEYNNWEREEDYANEQQSAQSIQDTILYLRCLNNENVSDAPEIDDRPAYLEWAVWRSFLAIDEIKSSIHETRRFPVDQDFRPRNTAPGGGSDLLFEFETYVLVVEVTLTVSHRQMAVESEPVIRHTVQYKELYPDKDVYCLFIAPRVDNNVVEAFRIGVWYNEDEEQFVNIIPMNLSEFINAIDTLLHRRFKNSHFKSLLDRCLIFRNVRAPQWKQSIAKEVTDWKRRLIA